MREKISACIIAYNEENKIRRCLESVKWCDEIVVMDSYSTDKTLDICREYTQNIYQQQWLGYVGQRNLIREKATNEWIIFLDADEEVSPALRNEIQAEFEAGPGSIIGYEFPRLVYYLGKWIHHGEWYPDIKLRLFKKIYGRTEGEEPHDQVVVKGPVKRLKSPLWHYTYSDIRDQLDTLNRFSTITANQKFIKEYKFHWIDLIVRPVLRFLKGYILKLGFLDGPHGFIIAILSSYGVFAKYAKHWEISRRHKANYKELPDVS